MVIKYLGIILISLIVAVWTIAIASVYKTTVVNAALIIGLVLILQPGYWYLLWALCLGLFFDFFSGAPGLFYTIIFLGTFSLARNIDHLFSHENMTRFFSLSFLTVISYHVITIFLTYILSRFRIMQFNMSFADFVNFNLLWEIIIVFITVILLKFLIAVVQSRKLHTIN